MRGAGVYLLFYIADDPGRHAGDDRVVRDVFGYDAAAPDDRVYTDRYSAENGGARPDRRAFFDPGWHDLPVGFSLQTAAADRGPGIFVVYESDVVADENVVLDRHAFADKSVTGNFAVFADKSVLLDLHERADLGVVADRAAVQIYEIKNFHVLAELDVVDGISGTVVHKPFNSMI